MAKNKKIRPAESLDCFDEIEEGFIEGDVDFGQAVATFSFTAPAPAKASDTLPAAGKTFEFKPNNPEPQTLTDNRNIKTEANTATPSVEGEAYTVGRFYKLRYSTAKMLNEIKAGHKDVNVYMNTIVDEAIRFYYENAVKQSTE